MGREMGEREREGKKEMWERGQKKMAGERDEKNKREIKKGGTKREPESREIEYRTLTKEFGIALFQLTV